MNPTGIYALLISIIFIFVLIILLIFPLKKRFDERKRQKELDSFNELEDKILEYLKKNYELKNTDQIKHEVFNNEIEISFLNELLIDMNSKKLITHFPSDNETIKTKKWKFNK
jgi:Mg2+/citrate symporter